MPKPEILRVRRRSRKSAVTIRLLATVPAMRHRDFTLWPTVEGYAAQQSVAAGETVIVRCSSRVPVVDVDVVRLGAERTAVWSAQIEVGESPTPHHAWRFGCEWPESFAIATSRSWQPGMYEIRLSTGDGPRDASEAFFVLRHAGPERPTKLFVLSTNTWQAYNQWGGRCLYSGAHEVSFLRPIERGYIARVIDDDGYDGRVANIGDYDPTHQRIQRYQAAHTYPLWSASSGWFNWERRFAVWAESQGIELDYAVDADLDRDSELLTGRRLLVTAGHNEYWSWGMRDAVDSFVEAGGNWAIFSGNTSFWQVRYSDDHCSMVCFKGDARTSDPYRGGDQLHLLTSMWSDPLIGRPENTTIGLSFTRGGYARVGHATPRSSGGYTVLTPDHWVFAGADLHYGDTIGAAATAVGYEVDGCDLAIVDGRVVPTGADSTPASLEVLATAPAHLISITVDVCEAPVALWAGVDPPGDLEHVASVLFGDDSPSNVDRIRRGNAVMAIFTKGEGTVFNAGSANWCYGLGADPTVEQVTANVINVLGS